MRDHLQRLFTPQQRDTAARITSIDGQQEHE
jgi:hypothetical protein